jgi:hypothetical protein
MGLQAQMLSEDRGFKILCLRFKYVDNAVDFL